MTISWERIKEVFADARELSGKARDAYLREALGQDEAAWQEVRSLLAADDTAEPLLDEASLISGFTPLGTESSELPETIGPYRIVRLLGEGGMGRVYLATQEEPIRRQVALKVVRPTLAGTDLLARFEAERQVLAALEHPGIAHVYDAGVGAKGIPYVAMEFVDGVPIHHFCNESKLDLKERIALFVQVCDAVRHAHLNGIVHRDLKPSNILVTRTDGIARPKVIDFGIAKVVRTGEPEALPSAVKTEVGQILGTPEYMSPEQVDPSSPGVDVRSDVYSLGVVLYELLTGHLPFRRAGEDSVGFLELQRQILHEDPVAASAATEQVAEERAGGILSLPREVDWILQRALEKDREQRYGGASELADDLRRFLQDQPVEAGPHSSAYRIRKFARRNRATVAAACTIVFLLIAGIAVSSWFAVQAEKERAAAEARLKQMTAVYDFLIEDLIVAPNPWANARDIKVIDILDHAGKSLDDGSLDNPELEASIRYALGSSLGNLSQGKEAIAQLEQALDLLGNGADTDPELILNIKEQLGRSLSLRGSYERAVGFLEEVVEQRTARDGPLHPETLDTRRWLAIAREPIDFQAGVEEIRSVYADCQAVLPADDEMTESVGLHAAELMGRQAAYYKEAENIIRSMLAPLERKYGSDAVQVINVKDILAMNLLRQGQNLSEAEALYRGTVAAFTEIMGPEHDETLESKFNLGACLFALGKFEEAEQLVRSVWEVVLSRPTDQSPDLRLSIVAMLSGLHINRNELEAADELLREVLSTTSIDGDLRRLNVALLSANHARVLDRLARYDEAEAAFQRAIEGCAATRGKADWHTQSQTRQLASMYVSAGQPDKAIQTLRTSVATLLAELGPSDTGTQPSVLQLAECYRGLRQWDRAESTLVHYESLLLATPSYDEKIVEVVRDHLATTRSQRQELGD